MEGIKMVAAMSMLYRALSLLPLLAAVVLVAFYILAYSGHSISLRLNIGMIAMIVSLWIVQSYLAEMACRYLSLFHSVSKLLPNKDASLTLYVKRPGVFNMAAMWSHPESAFFIVVTIFLVLLGYAF